MVIPTSDTKFNNMGVMMRAVLLFLVVGVSAGPSARPKAEPKCGYESCTAPKEGFLNVHIVPHTHDDVGWLKTVDQYYYGSRNDIQKAGVQYILDSVVKELWENPERRFIYVETAFFWKWWELQKEDVKAKVHTLVASGRLKFVGGAWSMNDEANTYYQTTIDQFTWGLRKLNETFGACGRPTVGWQIDPFGHSREFASLLAGMGYHGLFLGRIDYQDKRTRLKEKTMEMVWRGDDVLGESSDIFTSVLYNTYSPPPGFCFDVLCQDEPIIDDPSSPDYNVDRRVSDFLNITRRMAEGYVTNNLLVTMGEDFQYQIADMWFTNLDKLIKRVFRASAKNVASLHHQQCPRHHGGRFQLPGCRHVVQKLGQVDTVEEFFEYVHQMRKSYLTPNVLVTMGGDFTYMQAGMWFENLDKLIQYGNLKAIKEDLKINIFYSTPDCYLKAVHDAKPRLPTKQDDFFPYASDPHAFWTGYFSSRPTVKFLEAETNGYLQVAKQLMALARPDKYHSALDELRNVMGVMQHHDAVTGTEKQHVARDYVRMVTAATDTHLPTAAFNKLMGTPDGSGLRFERCALNESSCAVAERAKSDIVITVYNPLAWEVATPVSIPVVGGTFECHDGKGKSYPVQMTDIPESVKKIPTRKSRATKEATFVAQVPALGFRMFYLSPTKKNERDARSVKYNPIDIEEYFNKLKENSNVHYLSDKVDVNDKKVDKASEDFDNVIIKFIPKDDDDALRYIVTPDAKTKHLLKTKNADERDVREFGRLFEDVETPTRSRHVQNPYNNLDVDEMRMLGDDPMVVTRFPDDEMADQTANDVLTPTIKVTPQPVLVQSLEAKPWYYPAVVGNNMVYENRSSGAYIFRPNSVQPSKLEVETTNKVSGEIFDEVRRTLSEHVAFNERKYKDSLLRYSEVDWIVGPISIDDDVGKEFIIKYTSDMVTNGEFYTDSNGRQMLKRILNKRPQWDLLLEEPVSGNYYPVTSSISVKTGDCSMTILPDRAVGGSSLQEGSVEIMVHRRLLHDDAFGVGEALNETVDGVGLVVRGTNRVYMCKDVTFKDILEMRLKPQIFVSDPDGLELRGRGFIDELSWLKTPMTEGVHLLTVEPWGPSEMLVRVENYVDTTKEVDLGNLLKGIEVISVKETALAANVWVGDDRRWSWDKISEFSDDFNKEYGGDLRPRARQQVRESDDGLKVKLAGKQIRTFVLSYKEVPF